MDGALGGMMGSDGIGDGLMVLVCGWICFIFFGYIIAFIYFCISYN